MMLDTKSSDQLFPTLVVGSLPRDEWVLDVIKSRNSNDLSSEEADRLLDGAVLSAIKMQESAGLDYVSDGEWRRNSYLGTFFDNVYGYEPDLIPPNAFSSSPIPAIVSKIAPKRSLTIRDARFLKANANAKTIATIPGPATVGGKMWSPEHSTSVYSSPEEAMEDCIQIINVEIKQLAELGVDVVQIDEPWLGDVTNPRYRELHGIKDINRELDLYLDGINGAVEGIERVSFSLHVCGRTSITSRDSDQCQFDSLFETLSRANVHRLTISFSGPNRNGVKWLKHFPDDKMVGLGVVSTIEEGIGTPDDIVERVEQAMEYIPMERITLNPECGFAPTTRNRRDLDEVYLRLKMMCLAGEILREKYG